MTGMDQLSGQQLLRCSLWLPALQQQDARLAAPHKDDGDGHRPALRAAARVTSGHNAGCSSAWEEVLSDLLQAVGQADLKQVR